MQWVLYKIIPALTLCCLLSLTGSAWGWNDRTHMAISKAAGYKQWYNAAGPDVTKIKAGNKESRNHYCNNNALTNDQAVDPIDADMVKEQIKWYDNCIDNDGHLYGAIIKSLKDYIDIKKNDKNGKYAEYYMVFCAHYIGDLSMPLHNVPHGKDRGEIGKFNKERHKKNDGIVEEKVRNDILHKKESSGEEVWYEIVKTMESKIKDLMPKYKTQINNEEALRGKIADLANQSRHLAYRMVNESDPGGQKGRNLTEEEAYEQLAKSAALLQAVLKFAKDEIAKVK